MQKLIAAEKTHSRITITTIIMVVGLVLVNILSLYYSNKQVNEASKKIYVVNKNKEFEATVTAINENRDAEVKYHVSRFHELFFNVYPDADGIESNLNRALYLSDESGKKLYDDLKERNFYSEIIQSSSVQRCIIDSVQVDTTVEPYTATCFAKLNVVRSTNRQNKRLVTTCQLDNVERTINSPNGLLIRKFRVLETKNY